MPINLSDYFIDKEAQPDDALVNLIQRLRIQILGHGLKKGTVLSPRTDFVLPAFLILYVRQGKLQLKNRAQSIKLKPHDFFLLLPFETYLFPSRSSKPLEYIYIYFDISPLSVRNIFKNHTMVAGTEIFRKDWYRQIGNYLAELCLPAYKHSPGHNFLLRHVTEGIATYILHEPVNPYIAVNYSSTAKEGILVDMTYEYTKKHLAKPICIAALAKELATSRSTLNRVFRSVMNLTPLQAMTRFKILLSLDMLKEGSSSKQIAHALGYSSTSHFSRTFKSIIGCVPTEYLLKK